MRKQISNVLNVNPDPLSGLSASRVMWWVSEQEGTNRKSPLNRAVQGIHVWPWTYQDRQNHRPLFQMHVIISNRINAPPRIYPPDLIYPMIWNSFSVCCISYISKMLVFNIIYIFLRFLFLKGLFLGCSNPITSSMLPCHLKKYI